MLDLPVLLKQHEYPLFSECSDDEWEDSEEWIFTTKSNT